jgi:predicted transcriptional regulator
MANNPTQLTILQDEIRRRYDTLSKRLKQVARYILITAIAWLSIPWPPSRNRRMFPLPR